MHLKIELVPIPVSDVDRAMTFYTDQVGCTLDLDVQPREGMRVVQLTPPGSACSIVIGSGMGEISEMPPGSVKGLHLVVPALEATVDDLRGRQVEVSDIDDMGGGVRYAYFADPDHNTWALQEMAWRTGDKH